MRKAAYIKAIEQTRKVPDVIGELTDYFKDRYSPRRRVLAYIIELARLDTKGLTPNELVAIIREGEGIVP